MRPASLALGRDGFAGAAAVAITAWALLGGLVLVGVVLINVASVIGTPFGAPFPGAFEMTEVGVAVAAFAFLPYCQLTDANVTADIFTAGASRAWIARLRFAAAVVALLFAGLLLWRMSAGMADQRAYGYTTAILSFPIWTAFVPILVSLALLALAAFVTLLETGRRAAGGGREGAPGGGA